jgi:Flp pilus assembly protein protease CpaA
MLVWSVLCILASVRDLADRIVSNKILTLMLLVAASPGSFSLAPTFAAFSARVPDASHVAAACAFALAGAAIAWLSRGGLGMGDVKLACVWALLMGPDAACGVMLACAGAVAWAAVAGRHTFAFAPWICAGCWAVLVYTGL